MNLSKSLSLPLVHLQQYFVEKALNSFDFSACFSA
jgi:hypothetical protein